MKFFKLINKGHPNVYNIPRKLMSLIQSLYSRAVSAVRVGSDVCSWFNQTVEVRQVAVCILSPDLFNLFLEHILNEALQACEGGVRINGCCVSNLRDLQMTCKS